MPSVEPSGPASEYRARLSAREATWTRLARRDGLLGNARLATALALAGTLYATLTAHLFAPVWAALPALAFVVLVIAHDRALRAQKRADRARAHYRRGLDRLEERWVGQGEATLKYAAPDHPFARDLDLFGRGSLFELLCTTRTRIGEETLARWMLEAATADEVRARQEAVIELRDRIDLREELALFGEEMKAELDREALVAWAARPPLLAWRGWPLCLSGVATATLAALFGWLFFDLGWLPFAVALAAETVLLRLLRDRVREVRSAVDRPGRHLAILAEILFRLEREPASSSKLRALKAELADAQTTASRQIARLAARTELLLAEKNQFFLPLAYLLLWGPQLAIVLERWRARAGARISAWLAAVGELEALIALSGYAYEQPDDPFPELVDSSAAKAGAPRFDGEGLGHPLLPKERCVRNDVRLGESPRVLVVSGSNMSGKSTLLRTVGVNAVLAFCGAPVRATRLRLSPLQLGATLRVEDSLMEGASRFYAEITRLRQLMQLTEASPPLLFLLDEILHGTNSHDRLVGAEAVVRGLVERGAIGLVTTHDLALAELAASAAFAENTHFEDQLEGGRLHFDYRMRPGVVRRSNALELMRAVGLPV